MEVKASPKPSQMEVKGIVLSQRGIRMPRDAAYGRKWLRGRNVQAMIFIK